MARCLATGSRNISFNEPIDDPDPDGVGDGDGDGDGVAGCAGTTGLEGAVMLVWGTRDLAGRDLTDPT